MLSDLFCLIRNLRNCLLIAVTAAGSICTYCGISESDTCYCLYFIYVMKLTAKNCLVEKIETFLTLNLSKPSYTFV